MGSTNDRGEKIFFAPFCHRSPCSATVIVTTQHRRRYTHRYPNVAPMGNDHLRHENKTHLFAYNDLQFFSTEPALVRSIPIR